MPPLPLDETTDQNDQCQVINIGFKEGGGEGAGSIWDDEDTRSFYEDLPKLKELVPAVLFEGSGKKGGEKGGDKKEEGEGEKEEEKGEEKEGEGEEKEGEEKEGEEKEGEAEEVLELEGVDFVEEEEGEKDDKGKIGGGTMSPTDELLARLSGCDNRELIDDLALQFCYINSKPARKKLVRALYGVPRTSLNLLPFYARLVASLDTLMKDIAVSLLQMLQSEFR